MELEPDITLWKFCRFNQKICSRLLNFICQNQYMFVWVGEDSLETIKSQFYRNEEILFRWSISSPYVTRISKQLLVNTEALKSFMIKHEFNVEQTYKPGRNKRSKWIFQIIQKIDQETYNQIAKGFDLINNTIKIAESLTKKLKNKVKKQKFRTDDFGRAYAGSQLQIQIYVNKRSEELNRSILNSIPSIQSNEGSIRWVSPLEKENYVEYHDNIFLKALELDAFSEDLNTFWPKGGPNWDALALVEFKDNKFDKGVLIVEAKSYPQENYGKGCQAWSKSRKKIENALSKTKQWLVVSDDVKWTGSLYQYANRLAHLFFFLEIINIPAWLVNVYFLNDPRSPTKYDEWQSALADLKKELGIDNIVVPNAVEIFLEAKDRRELFPEFED